MVAKRTFVYIVIAFFSFFYHPVCAQYNIENLYSSAKADITKNRFTDAFNKLDIIIKIKPNQAEAYFYRGVCKYFLGDYGGALQDLDFSLEYNPAMYDAYYYRALTQTQLQEYDAALRDFDKLIDRQDKNPQLYLDRAFCKLFKKDYHGAIADCNNAIPYQTINEKLFLCKAMAETALEEFDSAIRDYNKAIEITPKNEDLYVRRGMCKVQMKKYQEALSDFNNALQIDSGATFAYYNRALAKIELGDAKGGMRDYNTVLQYDPRNALTYYNRAVLKLNNKNEKGALMDLEQVLNLNPENILAQFTIAKIKHSNNDYKGALAAYNRTIELFPYHVEAYYNRAQLKKSVNDVAGATKDFNIGKTISEMNRYKSNSQRIRDSITLIRLSKFDADFNNVDPRISHLDNFFELLPLFVIVPQRLLNHSTNKHYHPLLQIVNGNKKEQYSLSNSEAFITPPMRDSSIQLHLRVDQNTDSLSFFLQLGIYESMREHYKDASMYYSQALDLSPESALSYFLRGGNSCKEVEFINNFNENQNVSVLLGKQNAQTPNERNLLYENALADFNKTVKLAPTFAIAYYNRAFVHAKLRRMQDAIKDYDWAIKIDSDFAAAYFNQGLMLLYLKDTAGACSAFSKAGEKGEERAYNLIKKYCYR